VQSPQFGTWSRAGHRSIVATTLFFAGDPFTRDTTLIKRVRLLRGRRAGERESCSARVRIPGCGPRRSD
jgi:hypothetical protein